MMQCHHYFGSSCGGYAFLSLLLLQLLVATLFNNHLLSTTTIIVEARGNIVEVKKSRSRDDINNNTNNHKSNSHHHEEGCSSNDDDTGYSECLVNRMHRHQQEEEEEEEKEEEVENNNQPNRKEEQAQLQPQQEMKDDENDETGSSNEEKKNNNSINHHSKNDTDGNDGETDGNSNDEPCMDSNEKCREWASQGECTENYRFMQSNCKKSCFHCVDNHHHSGIHHTSLSNLADDDRWNEHRQSLSLNVYEKSKVIERLFETRQYMLQEVYDADFNHRYSRDVRIHCKNRHRKCSFWASLGECDKNPNYMKLKCAPACFTCDLLDMDIRCPFDKNEPKVWSQPNDLNKMFYNIMSNPYIEQEYGPIRVYSRPQNYNYDNNNSSHSSQSRSVEEEQEHSKDDSKQQQHEDHANDDTDDNDDNNEDANNNKIIDGPWIITIENFLTHEECDRLIQVGTLLGYEQSFDFGKKLYDGTHDKAYNKGRTSTNTWLDDKEIYQHDFVVRNILLKMENLTGIHDNYTEHLQLLKYEETQRYTPHHDFIHAHKLLQMGPRIFTLYMYLNDVELGGGTNFPILGITVIPKKGKALIWPSVLNEDPDSPDRRTIHQALPVEIGRKYGANAWYHPRDYKTVYDKGCTG